VTDEEKFGIATFGMWLGSSVMFVILMVFSTLVSKSSGNEYGVIFIRIELVVIGYLAIMLIAVPAAIYSTRAADRQRALDTKPAHIGRWLVAISSFSPLLLYIAAS
jgi:hypothetical protein